MFRLFLFYEFGHDGSLFFVIFLVLVDIFLFSVVLASPGTSSVVQILRTYGTFVPLSTLLFFFFR